MKDTKRICNILKIACIVTILLDTILVFFRFPYKEYVVLGIYVIGVVMFFFMKHFKQKLKQSKIGRFKKFMNGFHIIWMAFLISLALFFMITRG